MGYLTESRAYNPSENTTQVEIETIRQTSKQREPYYSDVVGEYIVDAVTGAKYPWRVGSLDEQRFFKVTNTVPRINYERKGLMNNYNGRSSRYAYYENPHTYMKYYGVELDEDYVKLWYTKANNQYPDNYNK